MDALGLEGIQDIDPSTRAGRRELVDRLWGPHRLKWAADGSVFWTACCVWIVAWGSIHIPPLGVGYMSLVALSKVEDDQLRARMIDPWLRRRRFAVPRVPAFRWATALIAVMGVGVAIMRPLVARFLPSDHPIGSNLISIAHANALNITLGALVTVAVYNLLIRPIERRPLRGLLNWLVPIPAGVLFVRIAPVGGLAVFATATATVVAYLVSWFRPSRR